MSEIKAKLISLKDYMETKIIGQEELVKKLLITLLADGHALVEGAPGLAKTKAIKTLSGCINAKYNRIQFTPDLLPADITGSEIYVAAKGEFEFRKGPVLPIWFWPTKLTARRQRFSPLCSKPWPSARSAWAAGVISCRSCLWLWRRRTRLSMREPIICPKPSWTVF